MPVGYPLNDANEVSGDLGTLADQRTEKQLKKDLERASKRARRAIGGNGVLTERLYQEREEQVKWELTFPEVLEVVRVVLDDEELSDDQYETKNIESNNFQTAELILNPENIDTDIKTRDDYVLRIEYLPGMVKDLELHYAELHIARNSSVTTNDDESNSRLNGIKEDINEIEEDFRRLSVSMIDPQKGDHAKNQDRNSVIL